MLVDVGANVDCSPEMLAQFAIMGEIYSRNILHRPNPRVGILSIGEEEHKGNDLTRAAWPLLKNLRINFIGNVEGRDVYAGNVDVIVCDGFTGNVALKVSEGLVDMFKKLLRESLEATISGKIGYALSKSALTSFRKRLDHSEYGGAPAARRARRLHHRPRLVQRQRHQERDPRGGRILRRQREPADRRRTPPRQQSRRLVSDRRFRLSAPSPARPLHPATIPYAYATGGALRVRARSSRSPRTGSPPTTPSPRRGPPRSLPIAPCPSIRGRNWSAPSGPI